MGFIAFDIPLLLDYGINLSERRSREHIKPRHGGGETIVENLAWSCFGCNAHKHTKTQAIDPETGEPFFLQFLR
ncbi:MAG TPA: hypothetical protein DEG17_00145 [Cyanobacteria bacterium UBA11149]|nr:hypothetical protein [Cyanobacteria bacterium UBA11367]HBE60384.1 hypothetical protein [Cyanobacteria bacterium UBA11366]HBK65935.1 hypothetical protein [Cyanobacteria bacterium UBA11166]HBR73246.1 hypothetical protein [Cyanobacteria bacterium UBA11159]HBS71731.1 hypothetical protein [Cyanobacteria bacterium UBA11153]HBW87332.1 hypothetical protein [Cyanobacteria bacterium UBA11149]HCA96225.1 hypothetical protein [Cyanobacteria bacterium UBA9226]